jgi:hypothetical protein
MEQTTKKYQNTSDQDMSVIGIGTIAAGESVSITTQFQPPVVLSNYPGLVDVTVEEVTDNIQSDNTQGDTQNG